MLSMNIPQQSLIKSEVDQHHAYNPHTDDLLSFLTSMIPEEEAPAKWWWSIDDVMLLFGIVLVCIFLWLLWLITVIVRCA